MSAERSRGALGRGTSSGWNQCRFGKDSPYWHGSDGAQRPVLGWLQRPLDDPASTPTELCGRSHVSEGYRFRVTTVGKGRARPVLEGSSRGDGGPSD